MLDPHKVLTTIHKARNAFLSTPGRAGSVVTLDPERVDDVLVVGDLHGHVDVFAQVLRIAALGSNPKRHLVVQELVHDTRIDPDEGNLDRSHRLVDVVCALKCQYPERVHYLLGNHELSEITERSISKNGHALNRLFELGIEADYGHNARVVRVEYLALFRSLPLMVRLPNRVLLCHTIPDAADLERLDREVLAAPAWPEDAMKRGGTVYALTWGRDTRAETADRFAEMMEVDYFICGHHPCEEGFRSANGRVLIVDGTEPSPAYCLIPAIAPMTMEALVASTHLVPLVA
jgi:hypothetical protein